MRIYLDDDIRDHTLVAFLTKDGHDVYRPPEAEKGQHDAAHFLAAVKGQRAILTRNYWDFDELHPLVVETGGQHFGVLEVRADNDRVRDMSNKLIAATITKIERLGIALPDQLIVLNDWR